MESEKKPKRPRIGAIIPPAQNDEQRKEGGENRYEKVNYPGDGTGYKPSYQPRPRYNPNQGYQNRNYQNRDSYQRPQYDNNQGGYQRYNNQNAEGQAAEGEQQPQQNPGYNNQNRQGGYNNHRPGGYNQNRQGGYNNRQGGYNNNRQGGYNNNRQGGYNNQNRQGGYNTQNRQGGYNNQNRQGGYNNQNRQGGYNNQNRQGGYNNQNRQGGYNNQNRNNRPGGYNNQNRQGGYNNNRKNYNQNRQNQGMRFTPRPKQVDYVLEDIDPNEPIRLNKYMANAGICSRREADEYIQQGLVKVNGEVAKELGTKITRNDVVEYDEKVVVPERKCYVLLNKPKDCVTTSDDPNGRTTVLDLVKNACRERIYPVGRLDRNTTGVLLLTNDGDLASKLTHPKFVKKKIYHVWTDKDIAEEDMQRIADGIELPDGEIHADAISYVSDTDRNQAGIEIHSGRNRIVRRIFQSLGYRVVKLDRVYFAGLTKKNLPRGRWRYLTQEEVNFLRMGSFE
ncbi:MAG: RNA-binding S4 domain-containing protein [Porphyromonadaceae bacterium]|nr:RNA-binding S4 domain-containing protein [Porphyromonadaceae bacterium]